MAWSCVNNNVGTHSSYGWTSPNVSFISSSSIDKKHSEDTKLENEDTDFEFLLEDPVTMLSADQLFSDGKLVPLKFSGSSWEKGVERREGGERSCGRIEMEIFSPKAPSCTASWRELLGLKKTQDSSSSSPNSKSSLFKHFLQRSSKSTASSTPTPPLLKDSDISESTSISSARLSLSSSSSSGHELDDLPRLSLDLDKPAPNPFAPARGQLRNTNQQRIRMSKPRRHPQPQPQPQADESTESMGNGESRGMTVTADSPRLNASGKLVFHGLERSSSSPGNFTGGPRMKQPHGMPRSYSTNVRITPLLNVPVSSLRGSAKSGISFAQLFSSSASSPGNRSVQLQSSSKNRSNRTKLESTSEV